MVTEDIYTEFQWTSRCWTPASITVRCWQRLPREGPKGALTQKAKVSRKYLVALKHRFFLFYFLPVFKIKCQCYGFRRKGEGRNEWILRLFRKLKSEGQGTENRGLFPDHHNHFLCLHFLTESKNTSAAQIDLLFLLPAYEVTHNKNITQSPILENPTISQQCTPPPKQKSQLCAYIWCMHISFCWNDMWVVKTIFCWHILCMCSYICVYVYNICMYCKEKLR